MMECARSDEVIVRAATACDAQAWERMRQAGLVRGAYHYYVVGDDPLQQAHHFLSHVVLEPGDLLPVVDIEAAGDDAPADLAGQLMTFVGEIEAAIGVKPIIYTSPRFWRDHIRGSEFGAYPLWIAEYDVDQPRAAVRGVAVERRSGLLRAVRQAVGADGRRLAL